MKISIPLFLGALVFGSIANARTAPAVLKISDPVSYNFGTLAAGGALDKVLVVVNTGSKPATKLAGQHLGAPFSFKGGTFPGTGGTCGATLNPNTSCTVVVAFAPTTTGNHAATLALAYHDGIAMQSVLSDLWGAGVAPAMLSLSDGPAYDFGTTGTGSSADRTFTVSNTGGLGARGLAAASLAAPFSFKGGSYPGGGGTCVAVLSPGSWCTLVVTFAPTKTGAQAGSLDLTYDDGTAMQTASRALQGTGAMPAMLSLSDGATYNYGLQGIGSTGTHTFTVTNSGGVPARAIQGADLAAPYSFRGGSFPGTGGTCTHSLAPSGSCTLVVDFAPSNGGTFTATISVSYYSGVAAQSATRPVTGTSAEIRFKRSRNENGVIKASTKLEESVVQIASAGTHACALSASGAVTCWNERELATIELERAAVEIGTAANHSCARLDDGAVKCWNARAITALDLPAPAIGLRVDEHRTCVTLEDDGTVCADSF